jgi:hypothetical protein
MSMKHLYLLSVLCLLCACGGGAGGDPEAPPPPQRDFGGSNPPAADGNCNYSWAQVLEEGFGCHTGGTQGSGAVTAPPQNPTVDINRFAEFEPNNSFANANPLAFGTVVAEVLAGIEVTGSVHDVEDGVDLFILTPDRSGVYAVYFCGQTCTDQPVDDQAAIVVYDQFQQVIASTPLYEESVKQVTVSLDAGLPYYVEVVGYDTVNDTYPYRLVIIE